MKVFNNVITNGGETPTIPPVFVFDGEHTTYSYSYKGMGLSEIPALAFYVRGGAGESSLFLSGDTTSLNYGSIGYLCVNGASGPINIRVYFNNITIGTITSTGPYSLYASSSGGFSLRRFTDNE